MKLPRILSAILLLGITAASGPLSLGIEVRRNSLDLLDVFSTSIVVQNSSRQVITPTFPNSDIYNIELLRGKTLVWSYVSTHKALAIKSARNFSPGRTVLVRHEWNETTLDGRSIAPGIYTLAVTLLDDKQRPQALAQVRFAQPLPISALPHIQSKDEVTIEGTLSQADAGAMLVDRSGTVRLSHKILTPDPNGTFVVRGYIQKQDDGSFILGLDRWARSYDNPPRQPK